MKRLLSCLIVCSALVLHATHPVAGTISTASRTEILMRASDVVFSSTGHLETVVRLGPRAMSPTSLEAALIELSLDIEGEAESFVPFVLVVVSVEPVGPPGEFRETSPHSAREVVLQPGAGQVVRMDATGLLRRWLTTGGELYLRLDVDEPPGSERTAGSIRLVAIGGALGKVVFIAR